MKQYLKFAAQVVVTVIAGIIAVATDGNVDTTEWLNVVILALGSVAVLGAGNLPAGVWAYTKTIVSAATAGAVFLQSAITDGISGTEWLQFGIAIAGAAGVYAVVGPRVEAPRGAGPQIAGVADHAA